MSIIFRCTCGKKLQVAEASIGKTCACPQCGQKTVVPQESTEQYIAPKPSQPQPETRTLAESPAPAPAPKPRAKAAPPRSAMPLIAVVVALLLLAGGGGAYWYFVLRKPATDPKKIDEIATVANELDLIGDEAFGFISIKLGDWWVSDAGKKFQQQIAPLAPNDFVQDKLGVSPDDIRRITVVLPDSRGYCVLVSTKTPYVRDKVLARLAPQAEQEKGKTDSTKTYHIGGGALGVLTSVHFLGDRVFVFGEVDAVATFVERPSAARKGGAIDDALALTDKHLFVAGVNPEARELQEAAKELPEPVKEFAAILQSRRATVTLDVDDELKLQVALLLPDETRAKAAVVDIRKILKIARDGLTALKENSPPEYKKVIEPSYILAESMLKTVSIEQVQSKVEVTLRTEKGVLTEQMTVLVPAIVLVREAAQRATDSNYLKQLALAMHQYHDTHGSLPTAICGPDGKPLLSWRVAILPYIEQQNLYNQFRFNESWDSPHNSELMKTMPQVFASSGAQGDKPYTTHFRVFTGDHALFPERSRRPGQFPQGRSFRDVTDGTSSTLMIVESADAVPWTKPEELPYDPQKPLPKLGTREKGFFGVTANGANRFYSRKVNETTIRALITHNGAEIIDEIPD